MSAESLQMPGNNMRVKRRWFSPLQVAVYLTGLVGSTILANQLASVVVLFAALPVAILAFPLGKHGRMLVYSPLNWTERMRLSRNNNVISSYSPDSAPVHGKIPKGGFRDAFQGSIPFRDPEDDIDGGLPVLLDSTKQYGALVVTASGLKTGAGGTEDVRVAHMRKIADGLRDMVNGHGGEIMFAELRMKRPGDVHTAVSYTEDEMADEVISAEAGTPHAKARDYARQQAWSGEFDDPSRFFVINSGLEKPLRERVTETLFAQPAKKQRKPLPSDQVFSSQLWLAAESLQGSLAHSGAESPRVADAAEQAAMIAQCFTVYPDDLESIYRRIQFDDKALRENGEIDVTDSQSVRRGPFPFRVEVGHDFLLTGRTYHRILHILGSRGETVAPGLADKFVANAPFPVIFSCVSTADPSKFTVWQQDETARLEEMRLEQRSMGYSSVPARYEAGLEQASAQRDQTFRSGAAPLGSNSLVIMSGISLSHLDRYESTARNMLNGDRMDTETITGPEQQLPFFLYALGLRRL